MHSPSVSSVSVRLPIIFISFHRRPSNATCTYLPFADGKQAFRCLGNMLGIRPSKLVPDRSFNGVCVCQTYVLVHMYIRMLSQLNWKSTGVCVRGIPLTFSKPFSPFGWVARRMRRCQESLWVDSVLVHVLIKSWKRQETEKKTHIKNRFHWARQ